MHLEVESIKQVHVSFLNYSLSVNDEITLHFAVQELRFRIIASLINLNSYTRYTS